MNRCRKVFIRRTDWADYEGLVCFFNENNIAQVSRHFNPFPLDKEMAHYITRTEHRDLYYVALCENHLVGMSMLRGWDEGYSVPSFGVLVDHRFHNRGIGRQLTKFAIHEVRGLGCERVRLSVYASNQVALKLYISLGFIESSRTPVLVSGEHDEKIIMFKEL